MTAVTRQPFGLRDTKIYEITTCAAAAATVYGTGVDVPCVSELTFDPIVTEAMLEGDDSICASHANLEAVDFAITHGGVVLGVYDVLYGSTATDSGASPNDITYLDMAVSDARPYVGVIADSRGSDGGQTLFVFFKAKAVGGGGGTLAKGAFWTPQFNMRALPSCQDSDTIVRIANRTYAAATSTTWATNTWAGTPS